MLKSAYFSCIFSVNGVIFREEYELPYRTEEDIEDKKSTLRTNAIKQIYKDLGNQFYFIELLDIFEIHNYLIIEEIK